MFSIKVDDRQSYAVNCDTVAILDIGHIQLSHVLTAYSDMQAHITSNRLQLLNTANGFYYPSKHDVLI